MRKLFLAVGLVLVASGARAETLDVSPDVAVELGGAMVHQQDVARDDLSGGAPGSIADLGTLPDGADVVGGDVILALDRSSAARARVDWLASQVASARSFVPESNSKQSRTRSRRSSPMFERTA